MADYIARVELHESGGKKPDYSQLHREMEARAFVRTIRDGTGADWHLPTGIYIIRGRVTGASQAVFAAARAAAAATRFANWVFVSEIVPGTEVWDTVKV